jgi:hypothetical protein
MYRYVSRYNAKILIYHDTLFVYRYSTLVGVGLVGYGILSRSCQEIQNCARTKGHVSSSKPCIDVQVRYCILYNDIQVNQYICDRE